MIYYIGDREVTIDEYAAHDGISDALRVARELDVDVDVAVQYADSLLTYDELVSAVGADAAAAIDAAISV